VVVPNAPSLQSYNKKGEEMSGANYKKPLTVLVFFSCFLLAASSALASGESPVGTDKFKVSLGGFFPAIDSQLKIDSKQFGQGPEVDIESDLGFNEDVNLGRIEGYWRFAKKHRLYVGYYGFDRDALKTLDAEIEWDDKVFVVGAELYSDWEIDFLYAKYGYSFFQGDKWELSGSLGLYYLDTALTVRGSARLEGGEGEVSAGVTDEASLDLPIPLFGLTAEYYITPKWRVIANVSYFTISFDEWDGSLFDFSANLEYLFHKNFGIGAGYLYFDADVERDRDRRVSHLDYEYQGVQIYGIWHF
jgi:hypothetical protein